MTSATLSATARKAKRILRHLRDGAHLRCRADQTCFDLVTSKARHRVSFVGFEYLLDRSLVTNTCDHTLYADGLIWLANTEGGAA